MASVLFSTIGQAIGGPLGAAVGAAIGASVDGALFGGRAAGGADLMSQRSTYGEIVPRLYGRSRVGGHLIWASPAVAGGSGPSARGGAVTSLAFALSSAPVESIGRIWADGREIRDGEGRFQSPTTFRLHRGLADGPVDPLIAAAEGAGRAPDYRGLAYVVLENFALAPFGNRIPGLSFEVVADGNGIGDWVTALAGSAGIKTEAIGSDVEALGYGAGASRLADDVEALAGLGRARLSFAGGGLRLAGEPRVFDVPVSAFLRAPGGAQEDLPVRSVQARPAAISLSYFDAERSYQAGRQRVARGRSGRAIESSAPLTASAGMARGLAGRLLKESEAGAETLRFGLSWRWLDLSVGDDVRFGDGSRWRIARRDVRGLALWFDAVRTAEASDGMGGPDASADAGRDLPAPFVPVPPTQLLSFEAPVPLGPGGVQLLVAATGEAGWRGAEVAVLEGGEERSIATIGPGPQWGLLDAPLSPGVEELWDEVNVLVVRVGAGEFESRDQAAVLAGANLILVGGELLQYRVAEVLDDARVRLSGLLRGRYGTGFRQRTAEAGTRVVRVRPEKLGGLALGRDSIGRDVVLLAVGGGDPVGGTEATHRVEGLGFAPLAPAHFRCERLADGTIQADWVHRHRECWEWAALEPAVPLAIWRHRGAAGPVAELPVRGSKLSLTVDAQVQLFGAALGSGLCLVEVPGDGPAGLRQSRAIMI